MRYCVILCLMIFPTLAWAGDPGSRATLGVKEYLYLAAVIDAKCREDMDAGVQANTDSCPTRNALFEKLIDLGYCPENGPRAATEWRACKRPARR